MGRHRAFDLEEALNAARNVFWLKGYEAASISDLTEAMGINSPSLYAAFGSKQGLFRAVLEHYDAAREKVLLKIIDEPTARDVALRYLSAIADYATDKKHPPGCLLVKAGLSTVEGEVAEQISRHKMANELALRERFECAKRSGDLPEEAKPAELARYIMAIGSGLCVQAVNGASREDLRNIAAMAVNGLPQPGKAAKRSTARENA
ncbi:AcrR family transcriptional regulator [Rhizomicrobium palustre]|uniref:AcrR family transcriptional regulator n=1 Tax=Rhizomicrobium palustre TaxID=189966 RepID=A0A846MYS4_9PROT|nr:TetR/AcrR family transcriptional regulator [Rhizomicrobium palustre]NIK88365.1 AcrR family transcriptional regulator [Rhizomicrobium palustre]